MKGAVYEYQRYNISLKSLPLPMSQRYSMKDKDVKPVKKKTKCKCVNVEMGSYDRQTVLVVPKSLDIRMNAPGRDKRSTVAVDTCLLQEVAELWHEGIVTTGCCCGHNKQFGYIGVEEKFIPRMKELGYKVAPNHIYPEREDSFAPKTLLEEDKAKETQL